MKSFGEWVAAAHPDVIEENWWKNVGAATAAGLGAAAAGAGYNAVYNQPVRPIPGQVAPQQPGVPPTAARPPAKPGQPVAQTGQQPAPQPGQAGPVAQPQGFQQYAQNRTSQPNQIVGR